MLQNDMNRSKRAYLIYELDCDVQIDLITNPGTELEFRSSGTCVFNFEFNKTFYLFAFDLPDINFLREKNSVIFEITYCPKPLIAVSFYSDRYALNLSDSITNYYMIGLKFKRNERNLYFSDPPGYPMNNQVAEFAHFYYYLFSNYTFGRNKKGYFSEGQLLSTFVQIQDLIMLFKSLNNNNITTNPKAIADYFKFLDDFILDHVKSKDIPEVFLFLVSMFGIFNYDFFVNKDFSCKNSSMLMSFASQTPIEFFLQLDQCRSLKAFLTNGFYVLMNMGVKDGFGMWTNFIKFKVIPYLFESEAQFFTRLSDFIKKTGAAMRVREEFEEAKKYLLGYFKENEKDIKNPLQTLNMIVKNIAILATGKETLLNTIIEFNRDGLLDSEKLKTLKEEIKRKRWEYDIEENFFKQIIKINELIALGTPLKDEFKNILYEFSYTVKYIIALLRLHNYKDIEMNLLKKSINAIYDFSLDDYMLIVSDLVIMPDSIKKELIDSSFYDRIRQSLKKLKVPFEESAKPALRTILLCQELFPEGSIDYLKDFIKNKPTFEDLCFMTTDLIFPQKELNKLKKFQDIWLNIKNHLVNVHIEAHDLLKSFSSLMIALDVHNDGVEFKNWFCDEFWKTINQRYSSEVFFGITQFFNDTISPLTIESYVRFTNNHLETIPNDSMSMYDKVNTFVTALCMLNENGEKIIQSNNTTTESLITTLLNVLTKSSDPNKLVNKYLYELPSKDSFWYKLIKASGKQISFLSHEYIQTVTKLIGTIFQDVKQGKTTISDFILISKQTESQRQAFLAYFDNEDITETLNSQLEVLGKNLKIVADLETFFNAYGIKIDKAEEYGNFIKDTKQGYKTTQFVNFTIRADLLELYDEISVVNKWSETVMFRNIFDLEYAGYTEATDLKTVLEVCKTSSLQIKKILDDILHKEDFSQLTLSVTKRYFKGLDNFTKESNILDEMIGLTPTQKSTLVSILKTYCDITNYIRFSNTMIKLDSIYRFSKNNNEIYKEFLDLINNTDSSFDKIFNSSVKLSQLRTKYLEKRDIENILYELSEDNELVAFLLHTPEDDIRNMVDAVDEHGDSFIRVQTIRDLLIIGSFVRTLCLRDFSDDIPNNPREDELVERIHGAFKKSTFSGIDVLMNSCMKQYLGIKHLHNELSNREEASKIKAKDIAKGSCFDYIFNPSKKLYEVGVVYGKNDKRINFRDLSDLRDRVLLLLYNQKGKEGDDDSNKIEESKDDLGKEILISFIKIVELSEKILFILNDIYHNGYPAVITKQLNMTDGDYSIFQNFYEQILDTNTKWNDDLKEAYTKYYPLTYFNGNQFWELESLFLNINGDEDVENMPGFYLLKFANPELTNLKSVSISYEVASNPKERIFKLGDTLSKVITSTKSNRQIDNLRKINLNLKGSHFIYSLPSNLRIYSYILSIHFSIDGTLPDSNQIFYCRKNTTFHEIISFLYRFFYCGENRLFSIVKVENLSFELQNFLVEHINKICKNRTIPSYLSIICCDSNSFLHSQFSENNSIYFVRDFDVLDDILIATTLDTLNLNTHVIRSDDTGAGKTYFIRSKVDQAEMDYIDFPIVDCIDIARINEELFKLNKRGEKKIKFIHFTIVGVIDDYEMLDYIIFSIVIINCLKHDLHVSFRKPTDPIYIEVSNTYNDYLYSSISVLGLIPSQEMIIAKDNIKNIEVIKDVKDPLQVVVNYLYCFDRNELNETDMVPEMNQNMKIFSREDCLLYLNKYFVKDSDMTFRQIQIFLSVLNDQLIKFSNNYFFSVENIGYIQDDNLADIRQRIMHCLLQMTEEFTTRSIKAVRESQNQTVMKLKRSFSREEIRSEETKMEEINSLENILSWSSSNHLIIMFHEDGMCVTPVYREASKVTEEVRMLTESQRTNLEDYQVYSHFELLEKLLNIVGRQFVMDKLTENQDYILTADNFLKMLLIIIRARCNVPIVIMGETGCGKTSLVRFLATEIMQEGFEVINFHAGIKEQHIIEKMQEIVQRADILKVTENKIWVFLDEINTCDCLGLITELICHKTMKGTKIPENIIFIAACNPYKVRRNTNEVGLIKQRIATRLVYTVHPLPDALMDYVWDYGSLTDNEERLYIGNILSQISGAIKKVSIDLVCKSQIFIRQCEDKYSVSLRDVARFKILHEWFHTTLTQKNEEIIGNKSNQGYGTTNIKYTGKLMISRKALILSLMLCYYNRISKNCDRMDYKKIITSALEISETELDEMINEEQRDMITRMELPPAIAINKALLENVFTLMVCVINKIPLFICGKPGCSKSLSVQLLVSNLRGQDSHDNFFKKLPRILAIPYQGSESSTSEGIEKIFEKARGVLNNNQDNSILPLIVFDEIGLAEISKNNPLKVLHSLLEPEKAEIAFVGISNWRLDASKMNRAVFLARPDPDLEDLENTALSIFDYYIKEPRFDEKLIMKTLAKTYYEFKNEQANIGYPDFHGTRDFYSLLKQVTREFNIHHNKYNEVKYTIIKDALCRNFGGLPNSINTILSIFTKYMNTEVFDKRQVMDLVKENLADRDSRFLLLFTNGESASYILDNYLKTDLKERVFMIGSEFANDKDKDEHSFRLLSDIILYMESGNSIIMKNLDQIYGSLYDLFNQNFMIVGQKKNCRIALGSTNNPMCFVNNNFHCVVLVDLKDLDRMDPPFLNRFEKQILTFESVLNTRQKTLVRDLNSWIHDLTTLENSNPGYHISRSELIISYNDDLCPSLVLKNYNDDMKSEEILEKCKKDILQVSSVSMIVYSILSKMYQHSRDEVSKIHKTYFEEQHHDSLKSYLNDLNTNSNRSIVYTYSNILDEFDIDNTSYSILNIAEIKSEKEFDTRFKAYLANSTLDWLFIKFDIVKEKNHIPMIKFKVDKYLAEYAKMNGGVKNVAMVIYLSKRNMSSNIIESHFLSGWDQIMIDCLSGGQINTLKNLLDLSTLEVCKANLDSKSIAEIVFNIYLKFNFSAFNDKDVSLVKLYITESIHKIENDPDIFELISKKCMEFLEDKDLGDWKIKICCDQSILSKSVNTFQAIKLVVEQIIEEPLLKIVHFLETESALNSYFYEGSDKAAVFKQIWKEQFDKKDLNQIYSYNTLSSLNVNILFNLKFPFSKNDIYEIAHALHDHTEKIYMLDNAIYFADTKDDEMINTFNNELEICRNIIKKSSILFKVLNNYNERVLENAYVNDIISYFLQVELKKEYKWKNTLELLTKNFVGFDIENIEYIYLFLWKNKKKLDMLFNTLDSLSLLFDVAFIETHLSNEKLYDERLSIFSDIQIHKDAEVKTFLNIFDSCSKIILSQLNNQNESYPAVLNTFIASLTNFSFEVKEAPESLNILIVTNEFLKILSAMFRNNKPEVASRSKDIFIDEHDKINLRDYQVLQNILDIVDREFDDLSIRQKDPENEIKLTFVKSTAGAIISSKLSMFENVIIGRCDFNTKLMIINNILKDEDLTMYSSMIFYRIFENMKIDESLKGLINSEFKQPLDEILEKKALNSPVCTFFCDFFRKFFHQPDKSEYLSYLRSNLDNSFNYLEIAKDVKSKYNTLIGFAGLKHYLEVYGLYLADDSIEKDFELNQKVNSILDVSDPFIEMLRNFVLKTMAGFYGGNANSLHNIDYSKLEVKWVNNKLFENNDNSLGIEPNLPDFEKINKEYNLFFVSLLNDDSEENIQKLNDIILNAQTKFEIRFVLIQFFVNKVWLSYSNPKFKSSFTYSHIIKLFEKISSEIKLTLGEAIHNFIQGLVHNFPKNDYLAIHPTSETNKVGMLCLSMQMVNMILSFPDCCLSKFYYNGKGELIKDLSHWNAMYLPGGFVDFHDENLLIMMKHIDENYNIYGTSVGLYECTCGFLYMIGDCTRPAYVSACPNCTGKIGGQGHVLTTGHICLINADNRNEPGRKKYVIEYLGKKLRNNSGYVAKMADELSMHYSIRGLSSISFRFLNFFNHSVIYLLLELGYLEEKTLSNVIFVKDMVIKPRDYLVKHMTTDIAKISELIKSKEFYIFMHVVFNEFLQLSKEGFRFDTAIEREKFEIAFQTKIIQPKLDKLAGEISGYKLFFNNDKKLTYLSILNENFQDDEIKSLPNYDLFRIFRYSRLGNWEDLRTEFIKKKANYQFLKLLIEKFDELTLLSNLYPIMNFTNYIMNLCNYRFSRAEAKEKKIRDVVEGNPTAEGLFIEFAKAWKKIAYKATQWQCKSLPVLDGIHIDLPLSFVLVDDRELGYGMYMAAAFQYLGMIQNEVLEAIVYLIKENNNYQIWGNMDIHKYNIQKISSHEIIMYETDKDFIAKLTDTFAKFYDIYNTEYGQGVIVEYNFEKIENELAFKLLTNKKFLDYENLNKIQYKFELLSVQNKHSNLLTDIKSKIDQTVLIEDDVSAVRRALDKLENQNVAYLHQIFTSLEVILCNIRYSTQLENVTLDNYILKMTGGEKIAHFLKEQQPFCGIRISNILSLYELVEDRLFKYIVEYISEEYNKPLPEDVVGKIIEFLVISDVNSRYPNAIKIRNVIQRFVIRCLVARIEPSFPIKEYMNRVDFWDVDTPEDMIDNLYFEFPDEIFLFNTLSLLEFMNDYIKTKMEDKKGLGGYIDEDRNRIDNMRENVFKKENKYI
jgi:hypothetical protein